MPALTTTELSWNSIDTTGGTFAVPDMDTEVLIYDADLDDVVIGYLTADLDGGAIWRETYTDNLLTAPTWWADKPFPTDD